MNRVLITGANGFLGRALCTDLAGRGNQLVAAVRRPSGLTGERMIGDIGPDADWQSVLSGCDAVVHLAARVHVMRDAVADPLAEFRRVNTDGTLNLARQAVASGVRRLVYVSTIKVNGEGRDAPYSELDAVDARDAYARSKWEAEQGLSELAARTGLEVVILRPPLVYGPGVGANFLRLMRLIARGLPLPFGAVENRRSLLYLGNLVDAIRLCLEHPAASGRTYLLSDGEDVSSPELVRRLARAMGRPARLFPVPPSAIRLAGRLLGKEAEVARLLGSLCVDSAAIRRELGWSPPFTLDQGLSETARWFGEHAR